MQGTAMQSATPLEMNPFAHPFASPLLDVTGDVACLQLSIVNVVFYGAPRARSGEWVLIDAALSTSAGSILEAAEERYGRGSRPAAIVLTHGHFDHVGALQELADRWDVPIYAHALEMPYLTGRSAYPPPDPTVGGGAMAALSRFFPRGPIDVRPRVRVLPADGTVPGMPGWRWVHTPGHTAGHVSFFRDRDRALIVGDAFVTMRQESALAVLTRVKEVRRPPAYYTTDWAAARRSVEALAALRPEVAVTGHGLPMAGPELQEGLDTLVRDFDRVGMPPDGRYVREPAVNDERGTVYVPPAVSDPLPIVLAGVGLFAAAGFLLLRNRMNPNPAPDDRYLHNNLRHGSPQALPWQR